MRICIFCSSSNQIHEDYRRDASELGAEMARRSHELVFGGGNIGLMGVVGRAVREGGGVSTGVIPRFMQERGVADEAVTELVLTEDMRQRKAEMERRADAFLVLPGGFGTAEEILEILTLKQLRRHDKAIVLLNTRDYFAGLLRFFEHVYTEGFADAAYRGLYHVAATPVEALAHLEAYAGSVVPDKFAPH